MTIHKPPHGVNPETHPAHILLIEDDNGDARLIEEALKESQFTNTIDRVTDGSEALEYLGQSGNHKDARRPDLILLDLNLPKMDGRQFLEKLNEKSEFDSLPIVVLSTSDDASDVENCYANRANCFITKPLDFDKFIGVIRSIEHFWLTVAKLPEKH